MGRLWQQETPDAGIATVPSPDEKELSETRFKGSVKPDNRAGDVSHHRRKEAAPETWQTQIGITKSRGSSRPASRDAQLLT